MRIDRLIVTTLLAAIILSTTSFAQPAQYEPLKSATYEWPNVNIGKGSAGAGRRILEGSTTDLASLEIDAQVVGPGMTLSLSTQHRDVQAQRNDGQRVVIIREGTLEVTAGPQTKVVGAGSVAVADAPGSIELKNVGNGPAAFYNIQLRTKEKFNSQRAQNSKGAFIVDWNDTVFKTHERGGRRNFFDTSTSSFDRFEMHVTMLKGGVSSHDPHKHGAEEIVLLMDGDSEMVIGDMRMPLKQWGIGFVDSQVLHNVSENGKGIRQYYAFQWQVNK